MAPTKFTSEEDITGLLHDWSTGKAETLDPLMEAIYMELHQIATGYMSGERLGHTLQVTALVHETFLRLRNQQQIDWQDRKHLFCVAAQIMRRILVDHARAVAGPRRGGKRIRVELEGDALKLSTPKWEEILAVHDGLESLLKIDPRKARVVELRYFGGLQVQEIAEHLDISIPTVNRLWRSARAWLNHWLDEGRPLGSLSDRGPETSPPPEASRIQV